MKILVCMPGIVNIIWGTSQKQKKDIIGTEYQNRLSLTSALRKFVNNTLCNSEQLPQNCNNAYLNPTRNSSFSVEPM